MGLFNTLETLAAVSVESPKGTAASLSDTDGEENFFDVTMSDTTTLIERRKQNTWGRLPFVPSGYVGEASLAVEARGSGTSGSPTPTILGRLLRGCGMKQTGQTFNPVLDTDDQPNLTIGHFFKEGKLRRLSAAMGTWTLEGTLGNDVSIPRFTFNFNGRYELETDTETLDPTFPTVIPPRGTSALTIAGSAVCVKRYSVALNANVVFVPCSDASGFKWTAITDFNPEITLTPETGLVASRNWVAALRAGTQYTVSLTFGSSAGNTVTVSSTECVLRSPVTVEGVDNIARDVVTFHAPNLEVLFS